jgi:hypothetical protein
MKTTIIAHIIDLHRVGSDRGEHMPPHGNEVTSDDGFNAQT